MRLTHGKIFKSHFESKFRYPMYFNTENTSSVVSKKSEKLRFLRHFYKKAQLEAYMGMPQVTPGFSPGGLWVGVKEGLWAGVGRGV